MGILQTHVSARTKLTLSPIFAATQRGDMQSVESLMQRRKHLIATNEWGFTAFMIATRDGHTDFEMRRFIAKHCPEFANEMQAQQIARHEDVASSCRSAQVLRARQRRREVSAIWAASQLQGI